MNKKDFIKELKKPANIILMIIILVAIFLHIKRKLDEKKEHGSRGFIAPIQQHE